MDKNILEYRTKHKNCIYCDYSEYVHFDRYSLGYKCKISEKMILTGIKAKLCKYYTLSEKGYIS